MENEAVQADNAKTEDDKRAWTRKFKCSKKCGVRFCFCCVTFALIIFAVFVIVAVTAEFSFEYTDVGKVVFGFHTGDEIWSHRIPILLRVPPGNGVQNETLLIFAEGRSRESDAGPKRLSFRRSTDSGKTWEELRTLFRDEDRNWRYDGLSLGTAVYDNSTGTVWLHFIIGAHDDSPFQRDHFVISSSDLGLTWTEPRSINDAIVQGTGGKAKTWMGGPGSGIQLESGRLIVCGWYRGNEENQGGSMVVISDDQGVTWQPGGLLPRGNGVYPDECQVTALPDGRLLVNMRDTEGFPMQKPSCGCRLQSISEDGGITWSEPVKIPDLITPVCQGSIITSNKTLYYTGPRSTTERKNGVIMQSIDNGTRWSEFATIEKREFGYSEIVRLTSGEFGIIFESSAACDAKMFRSIHTFLPCLYQGWGRTLVFMSNEIRFVTLPGP